MTDQTPQQPQVNLEEFSKKSFEFYNQIRSKLEGEAMNKYVALDHETSQYWLGETASEALSKAKEQFPDKVFYLLQVGSPSTFNIQSVTSALFPGKKDIYGFNWAH